MPTRCFLGNGIVFGDEEDLRPMSSEADVKLFVRPPSSSPFLGQLKLKCIFIVMHFSFIICCALVVSASELRAYPVAAASTYFREQRRMSPRRVALPASEGVEACLVVSWEELAIVMKKAKKGQYGCWELYGDGHTSPAKVQKNQDSRIRSRIG